MELLLNIYVVGVVFNYLAVLWALFFEDGYELESIIDLFILLTLIFLSWGWELLVLTLLNEGESSSW
ncbi:MAG: hypothetical protein AWU54_433 [Candidatus Frackibacter sp. T328-2]|jgi:hypothetical protein|nr:MAG: hypothetical protein AWU54_433 [Candidatus Frackibacter sp. T328-2]